MATTVIQEIESAEEFERTIRAFSNPELLAQQISQQGVIAAIAFLLRDGCTEQAAAHMLANLREQAAFARGEAQRRGMGNLFPSDQTGFS